MGAAIAKAALKKRICDVQSLTLVERNEVTRTSLVDALGCKTAPVDSGIHKAADVVVLAVKPQDSAAALAQVRGWIAPGQLVISIMAGVSISSISSRLGGHNALIRSMPNLPAQCGVGMTVYCCAPEISSTQQQLAQFIFESFGRSLKVEKESQLDSATALSGTGPAYFYFLLQQMQSVAIDCGYSPAQSELLLEQTMEGALALWRETGLSPAELIKKVASRGGTTEAALNVLENRSVALGIREAIHAANKRAEQLGNAD